VTHLSARETPRLNISSVHRYDEAMSTNYPFIEIAKSGRAVATSGKAVDAEYECSWEITAGPETEARELSHADPR
jgi:hypothetical protein